MVISLVVVFAAGLAVGLAARRHQEERPQGERRRRSWLTDELNLTDEQRSQMQEIWSEAMRPPQDEFAQRGQIYDERDEAVRALLDEEQTAEYERIFQEADRKLAELGEARRKAFEQAVERTKEMLTPEQRAKYEEMLTRGPEPGRGRRGGHRRGGPPGARRGPDRPDPEAPQAPGPPPPPERD
jgi:Spy/CpxP family protein refolding chaperone